VTLDPRRWDDPAAYLSGNLHIRLMEVQAQVNLLRTSLVDARMELSRQQDDWRIKLWEESVAAQDRQIAVETRLAHNTAEQTEADLQQLLDEREILMFVISNP